MEFIVKSSGLQTDFSELKVPVAFLDSIKIRGILIEETQHKQKEFNWYKKISIGNKSEKEKKNIG